MTMIMVMRYEIELTDLFSARTASLCSQSALGILNQTQRIGTSCLRASSIHSFLPSGSGFVLSASQFRQNSRKEPHTSVLLKS
jgi:hypothetical protein